MTTARPNPWVGAVIVKLTITRTGSPIAWFDARFPLLEATLAGCTLRRTKAGRLWASPPKSRRVLADGSAQYSDIVTWDNGRVASQFSDACLEAIERHSPELLRPLIEGHAEAPQLAGPPAAAPGWERDR